jgi:sugar O-acyltransferase (sialic acid O-acetyltransferase NeuD family)
LAGFDLDVHVVCNVSQFQPSEQDVFVCAIGTPAARRDCISRMSKHATFINVIHPTAILGSRIRLGVGVIICPFTVLTTDIEVGNHTAINIRCSIGHDAKIGSFCQLSSFCDITGHVILEDEVFLGSHASVLPRVCVEQSATVGAGSVAIMRVKAGTTVMGVPARPLNQS